MLDLELTAHLRNCILFGTVVSTFTLVPEVCDPLVRPVLRSWSRIRHFVQVARERFQRKCQSSFWEIDMTRFEP